MQGMQNTARRVAIQEFRHAAVMSFRIKEFLRERDSQRVRDS